MITKMPVVARADAIKPIALTISDAVAYSRLSRSRLYRLIMSKELPSFLVGGRRMIRRDALDSFFDNLAAGEGV